MIFSRLQDWISSHEALVWWTGSLSMGLFIASVILLPILLVRLPGDYLSKDRSGGNPGHLKRTPRGLLYRIARNLLGGLFVLAGIVMLVIPGQGVICIVIGLVLMDFPQKQAFLRRVVARKHVLRTINRMRSRFSRPPLRAPKGLGEH
jgi:hypothetical protein